MTEPRLDLPPAVEAKSPYLAAAAEREARARAGISKYFADHPTEVETGFREHPAFDPRSLNGSVPVGARTG